MSKEPSAILDVTADTFEIDVLDRSHSVPVVVDFWAAWCSPCRILGPVLERLAAEYGGKFVLAKADVDQMPSVTRQFGVQSIPSVFGIRNGRVRDSFVGVIPEPEIRAFLDGLMPTPAEQLAEEARRLEGSEPAQAEAGYRQAIELAPTDPAPKTALARLLLNLGRLAESRAQIEELERRGYLEPEAETVKAELTLRAGAAEAGPIEAARAAARAAPSDLRARFRLAEALAAARQDGEALEVALDLVERDRTGVGEDARKLMLALFQLLPADSELAAEYRRRLSFVL
jgi:putative thioredoxin